MFSVVFGSDYLSNNNFLQALVNVVQSLLTLIFVYANVFVHGSILEDLGTYRLPMIFFLLFQNCLSAIDVYLYQPIVTFSSAKSIGPKDPTRVILHLFHRHNT
jgi:hypothetical protein